ncbi:MAG: glycosyltransferase [Prevotella sp.]|jgi:glycosyltransferase involved in cell wall biosynthesis|nr:glycosyltransferase [Prevotella sp.]
MKVLYFINGLNYKGGIARIVVDKVNYLVSHYGHDITICTLNNSTKSFYPLSPKVKLKPFGGEKNEQNSVLGKIRKMMVIPNLIRKILNRGGYDIVVNAQTQLITWILPFICRKTPKIMEIHFSHIGMSCNIREKGKFFTFFYWMVAKQIYSKYDKFVILTEEDRTYWKLNNIEVINNFTEFKSPVPSVSKDNTILCVARYQVQKRLDLLIASWHLIFKEYPEWKIEVYGMGGDKPVLQKEIDECGMSGCFILHDAVDDIEKVYARSSIFALSSEHEGFALVLLEAMSASLPVCAFGVVGVKGIVKDGKTGLLCDYPDVKALSQNLSILINDKDLRERLGRNGHQELRKYGVDKTMQKWQNLFNQVLNHKL